MFCASATADSRAKDLVPVNAFKPTPYGLCCWTFEGGCSVVVGLLLSVTPIMGIYNSSVFCSAFLCAHSSFCNHLYGEERAGRFAFLSSMCLVVAVWFFLTVPRNCLQYVIVVFSDYTH